MLITNLNSDFEKVELEPEIRTFDILGKISNNKQRKLVK